MPFWDTVTSPMRYLTDKLRSPNAVRIQLGKTDSPQKESERVTYSRRMYDYYINDQVQIKIHLRRSMGRLFKQRTIDKMIIPYLNIIKRILNRSCLVYKLPAERYVVVPKTAQGDNIVVDEKMQRAHDNYQLLLEGSNVNAKSKEWHRQAKVLVWVFGVCGCVVCVVFVWCVCVVCVCVCVCVWWCVCVCGGVCVCVCVCGV